MKNAVAPPPIPKCQLPWLVRLALKLCLLMIHTLFIIYQSGSHLMQAFESYMISLGLLKNYRNFQLRNLKHLAIVVDSEEATNTKKVKELLLWLSKNGINYVVLYDMEGVLKKSLGGDLGSFVNGTTSTSQQDGMIIELLSFADSKAGIAKAANFLCSKYHAGEPTSCSKKETAITESEIDDALNAVGCGGPDPDLLLIYGPVRCHLGFPAWRIRYTEIIHMGSLKSIKYGAILKAFYEYSKKQQNYGT